MKSSDRPSCLVSPGRFRAFTLIELLTVIAIIGILAAIIIPTVGAVRNSARSANCTSNLRQIASAVLISVNDNRGLLPGRRSAITGNYAGGVQRAIADPLAETKGKPALAANQRDFYLSYLIQSYTGTADIWQSPRNQAAWDASNLGATYVCHNSSQTVNNTIPTHFFGSSDNPKPRTINQITASVSPSKLWMVSTIDRYNHPIAEFNSSNVQPALSGKRNYVFFDGHVETRPMTNLPLNGNLGFPLPN